MLQGSDPFSTDPTTGVVPVSTYAYRLIILDGIGGDLQRNPDWQFFQFDPALDINDTDPATTEPTPDGKGVFLEIPDIKPTWCMEIQYRLKADGGDGFNGVIHNTIHKLGE